MKGDSKYQPLFNYLRQSDRQEVTLTFAEIEQLMGESLPTSARSRKAWWSNRKQGGLQARSWMEADFLAVAVNLTTEQVTFRKPPTTYSVQFQGDTALWNGELVKAFRQHLKLSQIEFANLLGVHQATVSQWENNAYQPTLATSKYLNIVAEQADFKYGQTS